MVNCQEKLSRNEEIISEYRDHLTSMAQIATSHGISRMAVYKIIKAAGIVTGKERRVERICPVCGSVVLKHVSRARSTKQSFCSDDHFTIYQQVQKEKPNPGNFYSRMAYKQFDLKKGEELHFIDGDRTNFRKDNLEVVTEGEHWERHLKTS